MLLFVVEIIIMILAIILGLRTLFRVWYLRHCGTTHYDFRLSIASRFSTCHCSFNHFIIGIAGGTLQATGGIDYLVFLASKIRSRSPKSIIFIAPMIVFLFVFGVGTANIALSLEPIIAKTAVRANIQPKRPLTASVLTANLALLCSPAASATAYIISVMAGYHISMGQYLSIVLPTAIITMLMLSVFCTFGGRKTTVTASEIAHTPEVPVKQSFTTKTKLGVVGFYYVLQVY